MNYEDKPNRWISFEVAKRLGKRVAPITEFYYGDGIVLYPHNNEINFDPCNNASDAWPIIVDNQITIAKSAYYDLWEAYAGGYEVNYDHVVESSLDCESVHKNPLRAAMICFLKMKDQEQIK